MTSRVIVVGAGLAGLTVADELGRRGFAVTMLEARDRVGGRCHTVEGVDMGAHWIHGTEGNPVTGLARRFGLPTVFVGGDSTFTGGWEALDLRTAGGQRVDGETKLASVLAADAMWDALDVMRRERLAAGADDISLRDALAGLQTVCFAIALFITHRLQHPRFSHTSSATPDSAGFGRPHDAAHSTPTAAFWLRPKAAVSAGGRSGADRRPSTREHGWGYATRNMVNPWQAGPSGVPCANST